MLLEHMHKKFKINGTKIKDCCQSGRKVVTHNSKSDLPLASATSNNCAKNIHVSYHVQHILLHTLHILLAIVDS